MEKIHDRMSSQGKLSGWGVAKARANDLGVDFVTWKSFPSLEALDEPYDLEDIKSWMGVEEFQALMKKTKSSRTIVGEELLRSEDYTLDNLTRDTEQQSDKISFFLAYMTPKEGMESDYVGMEKSFFQRGHQNQVDHNPSFLGWRLEKRMFSWGEIPPADYRTVSIFLREKKELTPDQTAQLIQSRPERPAEYAETKVGDLRTMKGVMFDVVMTTDKNRSAVVKAWAELEGTWEHTRSDGSRRVKVIAPFSETLRFYDAEGNLKGENTSPMRIYFKDGIKHFYTYHANRTWNSIYEIHDGKWHEQMRGIYHSTNSQPDSFLIYERVEQSGGAADPVSELTQEGEQESEVEVAGKRNERLRRFFRTRSN